jgi:hypothetical protein
MRVRRDPAPAMPRGCLIIWEQVQIVFPSAVARAPHAARRNEKNVENER